MTQEQYNEQTAKANRLELANELIDQAYCAGRRLGSLYNEGYEIGDFRLTEAAREVEQAAKIIRLLTEMNS